MSAAVKSSWVLRPGQRVVRERDGSSLTVGQYVGGGGQGQVFRTMMDGKPSVLKWYFPEYVRIDLTLRERLQRLIALRPPTDRFLWPLEFVRAPGNPTFGYVMPMRETRFRPLREHLNRTIKPSLSALATVGLELTSCFRELHGHGFSYRDISYDNCFFDPINGEVRVCDNDNVDRDGQPGGVIGSPFFMAPELVRSKARHSRSTDLFSLAMLLFYLLHIAHPLVGRRILEFDFPDDSDYQELLANRPLFVLDPNDASNRPLPWADDPQGESGSNILDWWPLYPPAIHDLFIKSFTDGLHNPSTGRVQEGEWIMALAALRDSLIECSECGAENSFLVAFADDADDASRLCWHCAAPVERPLHLVTRRSLVVLAHDRALTRHHTEMGGRFDIRHLTARAECHPDDASRIGLRNLSEKPWTVTKEDGSQRVVEPQHLIPLRPGRTIDFGTTMATVSA